MSEQLKERYVNTQYIQIIDEAAQGQGIHLDLLAQMHGCDKTEFEAFGKMMQSNFDQLFRSNKMQQANDGFRGRELLDSIQGKIKSHPMLMESCRLNLDSNS